jgi:hypothetical protein
MGRRHLPGKASVAVGGAKKRERIFTPAQLRSLEYRQGYVTGEDDACFQFVAILFQAAR